MCPSHHLLEIANHFVVGKPQACIGQIRKCLTIDKASRLEFIKRDARQCQAAGKRDKCFETIPAFLVGLDELMDGHSSDSLERKIVIRTPENLEVSYELAGAGTRAAAYFIDVFLMGLVLSLFQNLFVAILVPFGEEMQPYILAILGVLSFIYFNAYFMVFELLWAGQSPGKRIVGIRVVKTGGFALRFPDTLIRNLLRAVDFLPAFYGIGLVSLLLTRHCQRLGDIIAGTLVVYQEKTSSDTLFSTVTAAEASIQLSIVSLGAIPIDVVETCDEFLRTREQLAPKFRQEIANDLLNLVETISGLSPGSNQSAEAFLLCVVSQFGQIPAAS